MQKVTLMLSSALVEEWGLERKDREEVTRDMIGNILRMIMVSIICHLRSMHNYIELSTDRKEVKLLNEKGW